MSLIDWLGRQFSFTTFKPFSVTTPFGAVLSYDLPEIIRMVHLFQVSELMNDDVLDNGHWHSLKFPVEVQIAFL